MRQKRRKGGRKMHKVGGSNDRRAREREEKVQLASAAMPVQIVRAQPRHVLSGSQAHHSTPLFSRLFLLALSPSFILSFFGTFFAFCFDHVFLQASQSRTRHNLYSYLSFLTSLPSNFFHVRSYCCAGRQSNRSSNRRVSIDSFRFATLNYTQF